MHTVYIHAFNMGDVEDPDLYAAEPLLNWQRTELGQWIMKYSIDTPMWKRQYCMRSMGYSYYIQADLNEKDYTFFLLRWDKSVLQQIM